MMPKLSIIVPVYNVEKYIRECLESIKIQTFTDYEVLLIDDGSPDNSGAICDEYATKDPRFKVFHKENGGVSSARNFGLDNAKGEWIAFMDSDDYWTTNTFLEEVFENDLSNVSLVRFGIYSEDQGRNWLPSYWGLKNGYYTEKEFIPFFYDFLFSVNNIYKKSILNNIRFDERMKYSEDTYFIQTVLFQIDRILVLDRAFYFYRKNNFSVTSNYITSLPSNVLSVTNLVRQRYLESGFYDKSIFCKFLFMKLYECVFNELKIKNKHDLYNDIKLFVDKLRINEINTWPMVFENGKIWKMRLLVKLKMYRVLDKIMRTQYKGKEDQN